MLNKGPNFKVTKSTTVCSNHFAAGYCSDVCTVPTLYLQEDEINISTVERNIVISQTDKTEKSHTTNNHVSSPHSSDTKNLSEQHFTPEQFAVSNDSIEIADNDMDLTAINETLAGNHEHNCEVNGVNSASSHNLDCGVKKQKQLILTAYIPITALKNAKHFPPITDHDYDNMTRDACNNCTTLKQTNVQLQDIINQKNKEIRELRQKLDYIKAMGQLTSPRNDKEETEGS